MYPQSILVAMLAAAVCLSLPAWTQSVDIYRPESSKEAERQRTVEMRRFEEIQRKRRLERRERTSVGIFRDESGNTRLIVSRDPDTFDRYESRDDGKLYGLRNGELVNFEHISIHKGLQSHKLPSHYSSTEVAKIVKTYVDEYKLSRHGFDEFLVYAMIKVESNFNPHAQSHKGARGLMQLMPGTAGDMGVTDIEDPVQNIAGGTQYISLLLDLFAGNLDLALAGYNAGPGAVQKHGGIPPYKETQHYVKKVREYYSLYQRTSIKESDLARIDDYINSAAPVQVSSTPGGKSKVIFKSGLEQVADNVKEEGKYCYITVQGRTHAIDATLIERIEKHPT